MAMNEELSGYLLQIEAVKREGNSFLAFFFNDPATTELYTLSLHDALPIRARAPKAMSNSARTHETPSTRSATTAAAKATAPAKTASAPPRTIGSWYAGIRPSARHEDAARAGHDRISVVAMLVHLAPPQGRGYLTVLGRPSNPSNSL